MVIDASAALHWLLRTPRSAGIRKLISRPGVTLHAPELLDLECAQALRGRVIKGDIAADRAAQALVDLQAFGIVRYPHRILLRRVWDLRHYLTARDAAYVALAEELDVPLLTCDRRLASRAGTPRANRTGLRIQIRGVDVGSGSSDDLFHAI